ncbi:AAA family ATPase [Bacillus mobilis]|uniref:AAA family ATPase n=1 Tax=Bacillus mobilis TaxID=2026190 RepID=UPI001E43A08A|nr:AAA family ATPase [Bacillus mobilis]MCC2460758.1 AAA family ATPase [Bacillus mobilis]MCU5433553.1 AAA family ATPase [Bacillus mobilis]
MKLEWVQIRDFRSINDTGRLYIDPMLTVLAGQNESGKSNILRALEVFSTNEFSDGDYPEGKKREESNPLIEVSFRIDLEDIKKISPQMNEHPQEYYNFIVRKEFDYKNYVTYGSIQKYFFRGDLLHVMKRVNDKLVKIIEDKNISENIRVNAEYLYKEGHEFIDNFPKLEDVIYGLMDYRDKAKDIFNNIGDKKVYSRDNESGGSYGITVWDDIIYRFFDLSEMVLADYQNFEGKIVIPKFKLLQSFEKMLPDSVDFFDGTEGVWAQYIQESLQGNEGRYVSEMSNRDIKRGMDRVSKEITSLFQNVYSQSQIKLQFDVGVNNTLDVYIYDGESQIDFMPSQRSKGFQWFLSFFFAINAIQRTGDIILLDEPGPYLHPKAQNDILKALEILAKSDQIIFTTHSPYLINPDTLERVRLVDKDDENGTVIVNQVHASSVAKQEVYTPIMTAIGLDLSKSFGTFGDHNVIVEGISDYYYLEIMKKYINYDDAFGVMRFIPSIGASQIDKLASLLIGWGVNFKVLLDNDNAGKEEKKELEQQLLLKQEQLVFVSDKPQFAMEDLFSREDFLNYIMPDIELSEKENSLENSRLLNKKNMSKALIAKMFKEKLQKDPNIKFTSQTIDNFTELFQKLYGVNTVTVEEMQSVQ